MPPVRAPDRQVRRVREALPQALQVAGAAPVLLSVRGGCRDGRSYDGCAPGEPARATDLMRAAYYETTETGKWALRMYDKTRTQ